MKTRENVHLKLARQVPLIAMKFVT